MAAGARPSGDRRGSSRWRSTTGKALVLGLPLVIAGGLDSGAAVVGAQGRPPPPGSAEVKPDLAGRARSAGPVRRPSGAAVPSDEVPPDTAVIPVGGDPQVLVLAPGGPPPRRARGRWVPPGWA